MKRHEGRLGERNIENVDEDKEEDTAAGGKAYIQMDLGLGVLEERREDEETDGSEGSSKGDTENSVVSAKDRDEKNILETLLGEKQKRKGREKIGIQELGDI